jgi:hypothetical protein
MVNNFRVLTSSLDNHGHEKSFQWIFQFIQNQIHKKEEQREDPRKDPRKGQIKGQKEMSHLEARSTLTKELFF